MVVAAIALSACGRDPLPAKHAAPTPDQRRAEALRIRENSSRGAVSRGPVAIVRSGDARVDAYRAMMEARRRAMHGVGPRTSDGEPAIRKPPTAR